MLQTDDFLERTFLQSSGVGSGVCWDRSYVLFQENKCTKVCLPTTGLNHYFLTYLSLEGFYLSNQKINDGKFPNACTYNCKTRTDKKL